MDESGTHAGANWCVVAGFVGRDEQWRKFVPRWKEALGKRRSLHMTDVRRWTKPDTKDTLLRLGRIPDECGLLRIFGAVRYADYCDLVPEPLLQTIMSPYMVAMQPCIGQALRYISREERIQFIFEQQLEYAPLVPLAENFFSDLFRTPEGLPRVAGITYVTKGSTCCIESADYLAYALSQWKSDPTSLRSQLCKPILGNGGAVGAFLTKDKMQPVVKMVNKSMAERWTDFRSLFARRGLSN